MKFLQANRIAPDETPCFAASHLRLFCLPMSHKKDGRLIWVNIIELPYLTLLTVQDCHRLDAIDIQRHLLPFQKKIG